MLELLVQILEKNVWDLHVKTASSKEMEPANSANHVKNWMKQRQNASSLNVTTEKYLTSMENVLNVMNILAQFYKMEKDVEEDVKLASQLEETFFWRMVNAKSAQTTIESQKIEEHAQQFHALVTHL